MGRHRKNKWDPSFRETLQDKREKEDAEYLARVRGRTERIGRVLDGQVRKDKYNKIMREFDDPAVRDEVKLVRHKERIIFLEKVLNDLRQWVDRPDEPLQLKPNPIELKAKIQEMKDYVVARARRGGDVPGKSPIARQSQWLTPDEESEIYDKTRLKIQLVHGSLIKRLSRLVHNGLPIERARDRLFAKGITKFIAETVNEFIMENDLDLMDETIRSIKEELCHSHRVGTLLEDMIKSVAD